LSHERREYNLEEEIKEETRTTQKTSEYSCIKGCRWLDEIKGGGMIQRL